MNCAVTTDRIKLSFKVVLQKLSQINNKKRASGGKLNGISSAIRQIEEKLKEASVYVLRKCLRGEPEEDIANRQTRPSGLAVLVTARFDVGGLTSPYFMASVVAALTVALPPASFRFSKAGLIVSSFAFADCNRRSA